MDFTCRSKGQMGSLWFSAFSGEIPEVCHLVLRNTFSVGYALVHLGKTSEKLGFMKLSEQQKAGHYVPFTYIWNVLIIWILLCLLLPHGTVQYRDNVCGFSPQFSHVAPCLLHLVTLKTEVSPIEFLNTQLPSTHLPMFVVSLVGPETTHSQQMIFFYTHSTVVFWHCGNAQ